LSTNQFTGSKGFSSTNKLSASKGFSSTNKFSGSKGFSSTNKLSASKGFSSTNQFTGSKGFLSTNQFTGSKGFSSTNKFSGSKGFSSTNQFTGSKGFSSTNRFSGSKGFSSTNQFTGSKGFSSTDRFTVSKGFYSTNKFPASKGFSSTNKFSGSEGFSSTNQFSGSKGFSSTNQFSDSKGILSSNGFTLSNYFNPTSIGELTSRFSSTHGYPLSDSLRSSVGLDFTGGLINSDELRESLKSVEADVIDSTKKSDYSLDLGNTEHSSEIIVVGSMMPNSSWYYTDFETIPSAGVINTSAVSNQTSGILTLPVFTTTVALSETNKFRSSAKMSATPVYSTPTSGTSSRSGTIVISSQNRSPSASLSFGNVGVSHSLSAVDSTFNSHTKTKGNENESEWKTSFQSSVMKEDAKAVTEKDNLVWMVITVSFSAVCVGIYGYMLYMELQKATNEECRELVSQGDKQKGPEAVVI
jgi:hypothetical protein